MARNEILIYKFTTDAQTEWPFVELDVSLHLINCFTGLLYISCGEPSGIVSGFGPERPGLIQYAIQDPPSAYGVSVLKRLGSESLVVGR